MKPISVIPRTCSRDGVAPQQRGWVWAFRLLLVMVLVFDQVSAPFHQHHHDFGIDADAGLAALHSPSGDSLAFESHAEDSHDGLQAGHPAIALRSQAASELSGVKSVSDALLSVAAFVVAFPAIEVDTPVPDWPDRGPPQFTSFKSLPPAGRAPPLHA